MANFFYNLGDLKSTEKAYIEYVKLIENYYGDDSLENSNSYYLFGVYYL